MVSTPYLVSWGPKFESTGGGIKLMTVWRFIAQSFSLLSHFHHLAMT